MTNIDDALKIVSSILSNPSVTIQLDADSGSLHVEMSDYRDPSKKTDISLGSLTIKVDKLLKDCL